MLQTCGIELRSMFDDCTQTKKEMGIETIMITGRKPAYVLQLKIIKRPGLDTSFNSVMTTCDLNGPAIDHLPFSQLASPS